MPIVYDKYWNIKLDGEKVEPIIVNGGLMAINVSEGSHNLDMYYNFYYKGLGIIISLVTLSIIILLKVDFKQYLRGKMRWKIEKD